MAQQNDVTQLLEEWTGGNHTVLNRLWPMVYDELCQVARGHLRYEHRDHTLNTGGLVHEAYLKLVKIDRIRWQNRAHFLALAAQAMRNILVNYAVRRKAQKRGGDQQRVSLDDIEVLSEAQADELLALDEALKRLGGLDARWSRVVESRFFGGLSIKETAVVLNISEATVVRDWTRARAWLNRELGDHLGAKQAAGSTA